MQVENAADNNSDIYVNPENVDTLTLADGKAVETPDPVAKEPEAHKEETPAAKEEAKPEEPKAKKPGIQGRIDELTKARREAERRAELAEKKLAEMGKAAKIDPDQFEDATEHAKAVAAQEGEKSAYVGHKNMAQAAIAEVDEEIQAALIEDWASAVEEAKAKLPDFEDVLAKSKSPLPPHLERAILESGEVGPLVAYHLAKNTAEAVHLARLSPLALGRELAKLEMKLQAQSSAPVVVQVSKAPAPIAPLSAKGGSGSDDDYRSWAEKRNQTRGYR